MYLDVLLSIDLLPSDSRCKSNKYETGRIVEVFGLRLRRSELEGLEPWTGIT